MKKSEVNKLEIYEYHSFVKVRHLGHGNYSNVKLLRSKQCDFVVGKYFKFNGDDETIKKVQANAKKEAQLLSRFKHKNIVGFKGITTHKNYFILILEYINFGNLENLLLYKIEIPLPWKIRVRFFKELAEALNYLHYHNQKQSYIHGDLKPQNVLLTDTLQIKLADFGASTIAKYTGSTTWSIIDDKNSQHTPFYTAPEFLRKTTEQRSCSMDVYSYGMVGYEIVTRTRVFSNAALSDVALLELIRTVNQKPDEKMLAEVAKSLKESCNSDFELCDKLTKVVVECWKTKADDRPKISKIKTDLEKLVQEENMYDEATDTEVKNVVRQKNLLVDQNQSTEPSSKITEDETQVETLHENESPKHYLMKKFIASEKNQIDSVHENDTAPQESVESFKIEVSNAATQKLWENQAFPSSCKYETSIPDNTNGIARREPETDTQCPQIALTNNRGDDENEISPQRNNADRTFHNELNENEALFENENQLQASMPSFPGSAFCRRNYTKFVRRYTNNALRTWQTFHIIAGVVAFLLVVGVMLAEFI